MTAECTRMCADRGNKKYGLVVGSDTYTLRGHDRELGKFAGQTVTVEGAVDGKTINVKSHAGEKGVTYRWLDVQAPEVRSLR